MKKLIILTMLVFGTSSFAVEKEINMNDLKPISFENNIDILFVEENFDEIEKNMETYENKDSFYYNYTMGKSFYGKGIKKEALEYFEKAIIFEKNNISVRMELLKIYLADKNYKTEVKDTIAFLEQQKLTEKEQNLLSEIKILFLKSNQMKSTKFFDLALTYDDNKNFTKDETSQIYNSDTVTYIGVKDLKIGTIRLQNSLTSRISLSDSKDIGYSFNIGGDYISLYKNLNYTVPFYMNFSSLNNNELRLISGLNYNKNIKKEQQLVAGVEGIYIINDNYDGFDLSINGNYKIKKSLNYTLDTKFTLGMYSENIYEKNSFLFSLNIDTVLKNKYYVYGKYTYEYVDSAYEVQGENRKDIINTLKVGYEQGIFKENMKLGVNYTYSYDLPNYTGEESSKNLLNTSIKWEF